MSHVAPRRPDETTSKRRLPDDPVARFSRGEISRKQAMRLLGDISYSELLDQIAERKLPLPRLPKEEAERQSEDVGHLLKLAK
jgi:hypothetical protein